MTHDLRAARMVVHRELIRFWRNKARSISALAQPLLYLLVLGTGLAPIVSAEGTGGVDFRTFLFPGIVVMAILFTAVFSAASIVWDREFGFMREMLVAPVSRWSLVVGKCLGGALVASAQAVGMLLLVGLVGIPYRPALLARLAFVMLLTALVLTALGVLLATFIKRMDTFPIVTQFGVLPLFFLSGALFPVESLPGALRTLVVLNPVTYAVDALRRTVYSGVGGGARSPALSWGRWDLPVAVDVLVLGAFGLVAVALATRRLSRFG